MTAKQPLYKNIGVQVIIAMVLGTLTGIFMEQQAAMFAPLGDIFISLIKMLVIPLVAVSIVYGAANLGDTPEAGKVGVSTISFFLVTSAVSVIFAMLMGHWFEPGLGIDMSRADDFFNSSLADKGDLPGAMETLVGMIPSNVFASLMEANILQVMVFCLFFGFAISRQPRDKVSGIMNGLDGGMGALVWMINIVMRIAPIGVFGLMADSVGTFGFDMLGVVIKLFAVYVGAILLFGFVFYPLMIKLFSNYSVMKFLGAMKKPQVIAFSTASSMATLPVTMDVVENELKVSKATASFVLPLGATVNMSGSAMYYGIVAVFFAQMFGVELTWGAYAAIIFTSTLGAIGQAGVPGPSLLAVAVLMAAGIPVEGLPLLFAVDRLFDMVRTALNITGDAACAVIVDKFNEKHV